MKKRRFCSYILLLLLLAVSSCGNKNETSCTLKGKLSGLESPYIFLVTETGDSIALDTVRADRNGNFSCKVQPENLSLATLFFDGKPAAATVFIDKGRVIEIEGDVGSPNLIYTTGGDENNMLTAFKKEHAQLFQADNRRKLIGEARKYIEQHRGNSASVVLIRDYFWDAGATTAQMDTLLALLTGEAASFPLTVELKKCNERTKLSQTGAKAPEFGLKNAKKEIKAEDYKDKYLLISVLYASTDSLRVSDFPVKPDDYKKLKDKNAEFLSIVLCDRMTCHVPDSIKWKVFCEPKGWASPFIKAYNIPELPYNILISPAGFVAGREADAVLLLEKIEAQKE
ncbi:MAG: DUF4369 domain-containing protein [Prevotella sp.]|jgi:hypothetical protein|nr:DUF4369 domain-containing protein [Prevotella sp.]